MMREAVEVFIFLSWVNAVFEVVVVVAVSAWSGFVFEEFLLIPAADAGDSVKMIVSDLHAWEVRKPLSCGWYSLSGVRSSARLHCWSREPHGCCC